MKWKRPFTAQEILAVYKAAGAETLAGLEQLPLAHWWRTGDHLGTFFTATFLLL